MSHPQEHAVPIVQYAALVFDLGMADGQAVPLEAHLLPPGPFRTEDGRPYDCTAWQLDAAIAARVIERMAARKNDTLICYEHQDLHAEWNGQKVIAAGWFRTMEWRDGKGLYATQISWVKDAALEIAEKKYRYISALFSYYSATGEVLDVLSVALTNTPALDGLDALASLARKFAQKENEMPPVDPAPGVAALTAQLATLNTKLETLETANAALTAARAGLQTRVDALEQEKATAALAREAEDRGALVTAALKDGRLAPAQKPWAEKQTLAALTEFLQVSTPLLSPDHQGGRPDAPAGAHGLTDVELAACSRFGLTPEQYLAAKPPKR